MIALSLKRQWLPSGSSAFLRRRGMERALGEYVRELRSCS